jgi:Co/Zn/Cd efflux system component
MELLKLWDSISSLVLSCDSVHAREHTLLSWVALWALGFVRASVRARTGGVWEWE